MQTRSLVYLIVSLVLVFAYFKANPVNSAESRSYDVYEVVLQGSVGNRPFARGGALFITSGQSDGGQPGENLVNFWLVSGKPAGAAGKGAIWLATHDSFYGGREDEQFATVAALVNELQALFDPEAGIANANAFSLSADPNENAVRIAGGQVHLQLQPEGQLEGTLTLAGYDESSQTLLQYTATITGSFIGQRSW